VLRAASSPNPEVAACGQGRGGVGCGHGGLFAALIPLGKEGFGNWDALVWSEEEGREGGGQWGGVGCAV
jgi:hypothetical protein